jgi:holo-[acyl-carrier protein] synthase
VIVGLGVELVDLPRFEAAVARFGDRLQQRLFTPGERRYAAQRARGAESLAVRFAAKLAARRALGGPGLGWRDLEIVGEPGAAPALRLHGAAARAARALGVTRIALSLSHDPTWCLGHVVLERGS